MEKGWKQFKEQYHIGFGHYLVFKFDTDSCHFKVCIFDMESVEIDYPFERANLDGSVVFLGEIPTTQKGKETNVVHCSGEQMSGKKRPKTGALLENPVRKSPRNVSLGGDYHTENTDINIGNFPRQGGGLSIGTRTFRFTKQIKTCNTYILPLPKEFTEETGIRRMKTGRNILMLQNELGKKWQANLNVAGRACGIYNLGAGWNKFLTDNKITVGNTLSFTFVSDNIIEVVKMVMNNEYSGRGRHQMSASHEEKDHARREPENIPVNIERDINHPGRTHKCSVEMVKRLAYRLRFPQDFVRGTRITACKKVMLKDGKGREWSIRVVKNKTGYWMTTGWKDFLKDNKVSEGDTVSFKFIRDSVDEIVAEVHNGQTKGEFLFSDRGRGSTRCS